jgi:hypothetical protein
LETCAVVRVEFLLNYASSTEYEIVLENSVMREAGEQSLSKGEFRRYWVPQGCADCV